MILDANVLLYAVDSSSSYHARAAQWLTETLRSGVRIGLPWHTLGAFLRIGTHPRVLDSPMTADDAQAFVDRWLALETVWVPPATDNTARIYAGLARRYRVTGNLVPDAQLAALAIEYGVSVASGDTDFARFTEVQWINPFAA